MTLKKVAAAIALTLGAWGGAQAAAVTFDALGDASTLYFNASADGATLNTSFAFTLTGLSTGIATFAVHAVNASSGPGANVFMSMGIDVVAPTLTGADANGIWDAGLDRILPGSQRVDLCVYAGGLCAGGAVFSGLGEGEISDFTLTLTTAGDFLADGLTFTSPYSAKWQSVGRTGDSYETTGGCFGSPTCGGVVPEPMSLALVSLALLGAAVARRRQA